jgi:hypothetical protein
MDRRSSSSSSRTSSHQEKLTRELGENASANGPTPSWRPEPLSKAQQRKVMQILQACKDGDITSLVSLAASQDGFVEDEVRRTACK